MKVVNNWLYSFLGQNNTGFLLQTANHIREASNKDVSCKFRL